VILTVDRIDALADAILIARRAKTIALRAVVVGMGLSAIGMLAAAAGHLPPTAGALLQEGIDVAAIAIALTALLPAPTHTVTMAPADLRVARRLYAQHRDIRPLVEQVRAVADTLTEVPYDLRPVRAVLASLETDLLPHERAEEAELLPIMTRATGEADASALSRTHAEIEHQVSRLRRSLADLPAQPDPEDIVDVRRLLYGLYAVLRLHNAQEEEGPFSLLPDMPTAPGRTTVSRL
jgi:iron-sulfur cluster repair protein YtfE (RIC family)